MSTDAYYDYSRVISMLREGDRAKVDTVHGTSVLTEPLVDVWDKVTVFADDRVSPELVCPSKACSCRKTVFRCELYSPLDTAPTLPAAGTAPRRHGPSSFCRGACQEHASPGRTSAVEWGRLVLL